MGRKKIIGLSSPGGHLSELIKVIPNLYEEEVVFITFKNGHTKDTLKNKSHFFVIDPHISKIKFLINFIQSLFLYIKIRPKVIISTGAGIAIPLILIGKFFKTKIIFIESGARIFKPSKTASFIYKFSDLFIIQYETLRSFFPKSKIGSL
jgi:UDP-N-acetylglucosamine:LPS N-acetylglucosamine transferase